MLCRKYVVVWRHTNKRKVVYIIIIINVGKLSIIIKNSFLRLRVVPLSAAARASICDILASNGSRKIDRIINN